MNRQEKAQITKKQIFDTAVQLFKENGYEQVTISEICKITGVAKGTFYVYYESKESIIKESYYQNLNFYIEAESNKEDEKTKSIKQQLIDFLILELKFAEKMGIETTTLAYMFNLKESLKQNNAHFTKRILSKKLWLLIGSAKLNQSPQFIFDSVESLVRGIMATWCFSEGNFDILTQGSAMVTDMINYYVLE